MKLTEKQLQKRIAESVTMALKEYDLSTRQGQEDYMYGEYGNKSIGQGVDSGDDWYDLNELPGSLSMQAQGFDDLEELNPEANDAYMRNGQSSRWASPTGDFRTNKLTENQLRKIISETIKTVLNNNTSRQNFKPHKR